MKPTRDTEEGEAGLETADNARMVNHLLMATLELYRRDFPLGVVHAVAARHGKGAPVKPGTLKALAVHLADTLDSEMNNQVIEASRKIATLKELGLSATPETMKIQFEKTSPFAIVQSYCSPGVSSTMEPLQETLKPDKKEE